MQYQEITSVQNAQIKALRALREKRAREEAGCFLVEGVKMAEEALRFAGVRTVLFEDSVLAKQEPLLARMQEAGVKLVRVSEAVLKAVSAAKTPQGIVACVAFPPPQAVRGRLIVALDGVQDPGNVGTIIRTADAAGFDGVLLGYGCADVYSAKVLQATMGSVFRMAIEATDGLPGRLGELKAEGYEILSSELTGTPFYARRTGARTVLVIGNESSGVSRESSEAATQRLKLPMRGGAESLNAAVAAGIMMYELAKDVHGDSVSFS